tara:strand:+ start:638 stop:826 length:189 start_codon:yes stop_codon:yes gene_type:complete
MTKKIYEPEEAKEVKQRIKDINLVRTNKKANARRDTENLKTEIEIEQLLNHDDKLYYEGLLD